MARVPTIAYRRKREGLTDYQKRLYLLKGRKVRLVVRRSLQHMLLQLVEYHPDGDKVLVQTHSSELTKYGMPAVNGNIPCAYLTGILCAKKAKQKGITSAIADFGLQTVRGKTRLFAALKGVVDGGLDIPVDEDIFPSDDRIFGEHIAANTKTKVTRIKDVKEYPSLVKQVKQKIEQ